MWKDDEPVTICHRLEGAEKHDFTPSMRRRIEERDIFNLHI